MDESTIGMLSKTEPRWMMDARKKAFEIFKNFPTKEFKESPTQKDYTPINLDYSEIDVSIPFHENLLSGDNKTDGLSHGVFEFSDFRYALNRYNDIIQERFMTAIRPNESKSIAFNYAFHNCGFFAYVPKNTSAKVPIHLVMPYKKNSIAYIMIIVGENSSLEFLEEYVQSENVYNGLIVEIFLEPNAKLDYYAIQNLSKNTHGFVVRRSIGKAGSRVNFVIENTGCKTLVSNTKTVMVEDGAEGNIYEMFKTSGEQRMDITSDTHHKAPRTFSKILAKGIGYDHSNSVFRGMIYMDQIASQCISNLQHYSLLLDETAKANAIPGLEIKTNDVQAKHGSAVGHIDQDHIFYLMSRGISRRDAEKLIIDGYFEPIVEQINNPDVQDKFRELVISQ